MMSKILLKATGLALIIAFLLLIVTAGGVGWWANTKFNQFLAAAQISRADFINTLQTGWQQSPIATSDHKNLLILGVDSLAARGSVPPLTDTMLLVSLDLSTGMIHTLPLPRDLWNEAYQTKINALYAYGLEREPTQATQFPTQVIEEMTGLTVHHTLVLSMNQVAELIDLIGGVEVEVPVTFTDAQFPRSDVDITTVTDPDLLYQTVSFTAGQEQMSGDRVLQFMRSRHGDHQQNTDQARAERQQLVVQAIINKLMTKEQLTNPQLMGQLYRFYLDNFADSFSPEEAIATSKAFFPQRHQIQLLNHQLTIYPDDEAGVITHPPVTAYQGQWVYVLTDQVQFQTYLHSQLNSQF